MIWRSEERVKHAALRGREKADVAVIGGGLTGITTALWLSRAGLRVVLVEAERIGWSASERCAGIVFPCCSAIYARLEKEQGADVLDAYAHTYAKAVQTIAEMSARQGLRFGLQETEGWMIAETDQQALELKLEEEAMKRAGLSAFGDTCPECPFQVKAALKLPRMYLLDPVLYLNALAQQAEQIGAVIYERSRVISVETDVIYTETGSVQAPYIVVASGYPIVNTPGWFFVRLEQRRIRLKAYDMRCAGTFLSADGSFACRAYGQSMLMQLGGSHVGDGKWQSDETAFSASADMKPYETGESVSGIECYTPDGLPYIGQYSGKTPGMFVAAGFGGNGIAGSMTAAQAISAYILGLPADGYGIYAPQRKTRDVSLPLHLGGRYLKGLFGRSESPRCSHMGCRLVFNPQTRLWECPCHGSRFDDIGRVVNAPAVHAAHLRGRK